MRFRGLKASFDDKETFFITTHGSGVKLHVEPANRFNGTQNYDGYFPRYYKKVSSAKAGLTKFLGKPNCWQEIDE